MADKIEIDFYYKYIDLFLISMIQTHLSSRYRMNL